jgi:stage V sporulation protein R
MGSVFEKKAEPDWSFDGLHKSYDAIEEVALKELKLSLYPNQLEIITSEQMLDAYSSIGMPQMYAHWSFGKNFARDEALYRHGMRNLAYEIVINSSPCISYLMESNSAMMQTLVIAHAAFGHNHFFKNNQLFRQWTDAEGILDYLEFAKGYISKCEERYGEAAVERILDAGHALMGQGVNRYPRAKTLSLKDEEQRTRDRREEQERSYNEIWNSVPTSGIRSKSELNIAERRRLLGLPEENILYFLEKKAPRLKSWEREVLRIIRHIAQYFYPQKQTKVMNEGCATYVHYVIMNRLYDKKILTEGQMIDFFSSHAGVTNQPDFDHPGYSGINPYALGFNMMYDIARACENPTDEDREWLPGIAGCGDPMGALKDGWANYRDESFIRQFLTPNVMKKMKLFDLVDDSKSDLLVKAIHNERGYRTLRTKLADQMDSVQNEPEIEVVDVDLNGDRRLMLEHRVYSGRLTQGKDSVKVLTHLADLWGYEVQMKEVDVQTNSVVAKRTAVPNKEDL